MNELMNARNTKTNSRFQLLASASGLALFVGILATSNADAEDSVRLSGLSLVVNSNDRQGRAIYLSCLLYRTFRILPHFDRYRLKNFKVHRGIAKAWRELSRSSRLIPIGRFTPQFDMDALADAKASTRDRQ